MIMSYLKIAFRHFQKNKLYAFVNVAGLAVGIAGCLLIGIYLWSELSYDRFHKNSNRIARVVWEYNFGDADTRVAVTGTKVGPQFMRTFPEVEAYVRMMKYPRVIGYGDKLFDEKNFLYADSAFFTVFSFPLLKGDPATVLNAPGKLVLTKATAEKYFGKEDPIGKTVNVGTKSFVVTGIAADVADNSQIKFDFIGSFKTLNASQSEKWNEANYITYLLLKDKTNFKSLQAKVDEYMKRIEADEMHVQGNNYSKYTLEPLLSVHLYSHLEDGLEPGNNILYIYILGAVALLILLIASVNYTNLAVAQSAGRSGEVGIRKVMGADKKQIFNQFISESLILMFAAVLIALAIALLMLPYFNQMTGKQLSGLVFLSPVAITGLLLLSVLVAFAAGSYPALLLSRSKVIKVLKTGFQFTGSSGLRKTLIVVQFVISIFLLAATVVILQQLSYIRNKDLGFDKEQIVMLPIDNKISEHYDDLKVALLQQPGVLSVGGAYESPVDINWGDGLHKGGEEKSISINALPVDEDFTKTLQLKFVAGETFNRTDVLQFDTSNEGKNLRYSFILNETAVKALGWTPEQAIGKTVAKGHEGTIKGVVKDFHFRSFHEEIKPLAIFLDKRLVQTMFVKIGGNTKQALHHLEDVWRQRIQHRPFEYQFLDDDFNNLYKVEERTAAVFTSFSGLAIFLACLGLFALTAYTMVKRTKEIGIRKILGATVLNILSLVSKDFIRLVFVAFVVAVPISLLAVNKWLQGFVYRIDVHWWVFAITGLVAILIALAAISIQVVRSALANPVKNLRTE
jgi:putative ABC transport system permease protein